MHVSREAICKLDAPDRSAFFRSSCSYLSAEYRGARGFGEWLLIRELCSDWGKRECKGIHSPSCAQLQVYMNEPKSRPNEGSGKTRPAAAAQVLREVERRDGGGGCGRKPVKPMTEPCSPSR